jgi:hypothetical protein
MSNSNNFNSVLNKTYILFSIYMILNFLGASIIQYYYLIFLCFTIFIVLTKPTQTAVLPLLALFMIEGQGRILWSYHPFFRNIFDFICIVLIIKTFIKDRKVINLNNTPPILIFFISMHFLWYLAQFANVQNLGIFPVFAATKIYIYPFILFFAFMLIDQNDKEYLKHLGYLALFLTSTQIALVLYQSYLGESFLISMNNYYSIGK